MSAQPLPSLDFINRSVRMPTIPTVFARVSSVATDPAASIKDLAKVVEEDQAVAARILRVANSAAVALRSPASTIEQACSALGMLRTRSVVLQTSLMQNYASIQAQGFDLEKFWRHGSLTGEACRALALECGSARIGADMAYTCGLMHDIGIVVMLDSFPTAYLEATERSRSTSIPMEHAETLIFGFHHSEVGAALAQNWRFPNEIVMAIRWHHGVPEGIQYENACLLTALANRVAEAMEEGKESCVEANSFLSRIHTKLGLNTKTIQTVEASLRRLAEAASA